VLSEGVTENATIPASLAGYTGFLLRRVFVYATQVIQELMPAGTHLRDVTILNALANGVPRSQQELASALGINRTIMVKLIDRLEGAGYVERRRNPQDRRSYLLSVTPAGHRARQELTPLVLEGQRRVTAPLAPADIARLSTLLERLFPEFTWPMPEAPNWRCVALVACGYQQLRSRTDEALADTGLQVRHLGVLIVLADLEPCTQQRLAAELGLTEPVMVQLIDYLERGGLVDRRRHPEDRRRYALTLTASGRDRLQRARAVIDEIQAWIRHTLGEQELKELHHLLLQLLPETTAPVRR